jgi:protoporphyrinogen oxidase/GT2 family glycosyltransferase
MTQVAILGAGIAGLSSAWLLQQQGIDCVVFEKQSYPGGLARSFSWNGFHCDFAAHRLFTTDENILKQMLALVPMGRHVRRSKIYLKNKWMRDPLDVIELGLNLPVSKRLRILWTYFFRPRGLPEDSFENYVIRKYGSELYRLFFQPYTEKLFGIPGKEISVLWARQKVRLSNPFDNLRENTKTKFQYFYYPIREGYGAITNHLYRQVQDSVLLNTTVLGFEIQGDQITGVKYEQDGQQECILVDFVISTLPLSLTSRMLGHSLRLEFQKVDAVYLHLNRPLLSDYHWIYFIDQEMSINRMVEFKNMSAVDTPENTTVICAEVTQHHENPIGRVIEDLERAGLIRRDEVLDTLVVRENFAYPVYNSQYDQVLEEARQVLSQYQNLYLVGRAAEFRHREADDNFAAAIETVQQISRRVPEKKVVEEEMPVPEKPREAPIHVVVLTYNHYEDTHECLDSVFASEYNDLQVVLVDNGSSDGTPEKVRQHFPQVQVIENEQNLGVPAGYNMGFKTALDNGAEYILMLNNDTILAPDMIGELLGVAQADPKAGIIMPKVLVHGSSGAIWSSGGRYRAFPPAILMTDTRKGVGEQTRLIEYAPSCGLLIHRRAFEKAGLFDPGYFFFFDDWDFSERVRAHGLHIWYAANAALWHKVSTTTQGPRSPLYWQTYAASIVRYYRRHGRPVWASLPFHLGYIILREIIWKRNLAYWPHFRQGIREGLQKPLGGLPSSDIRPQEAK